MLKKDLILRSPAEKAMGVENIIDGRFGAVLSRAGVGKTGFLVQIALTRLLSDEKILHISLDDAMEKINLRYDEAFSNLVDSIGYVDPQKAEHLWEEIKHNKVGIAYTEATFEVEKIREYLKSFKTADLDLPTILVIDGLNFDTEMNAVLNDLKSLNTEFSISIWLSMKSHREEPLNSDGYPVQLAAHEQWINKAIFLNPVENKIEAIVLKDGDRVHQKFILDPATMMPVKD